MTNFSLSLPTTCTKHPHSLMMLATPNVAIRPSSGQRKTSSVKTAQMSTNCKRRYGPTQGTQLRMDSTNSGSTPEEEFFCLTPEDARSIASNASGGSGRSRNASATSTTSAATAGKSSNIKSNPIQMGLPDTKIFSVAVEARPAEQTGTDAMVVCDVDTDYTGRFAVVSSCYPNKPSASDYQRKAAVAKAECKSVSSGMHKKNKYVQDKDKTELFKEPHTPKPNKNEKLPSSNHALLIDSDNINHVSSVSSLHKSSSPDISPVITSTLPSLEEKPELKAQVDCSNEMSKLDNKDSGKTSKRGKKKKRGGYVPTKSGSQSNVGTSTNGETGSSADTDGQLNNLKCELRTDNNKKVLANKEDSSTNIKKDEEQNDFDISKGNDCVTKDNEEFDEVMVNTEATTRVASEKNHIPEEVLHDEMIIDLDETLSSAFATSPKEDLEQLKDGSSQSLDNMSTEELIAEALLSTTDDVPKQDENQTKVSDDEKFSSEFSKTLTIKNVDNNEEDDEDLEEPFVIKERTPDSDDLTSSDENEDASEKDKSTEDPPPPVPLVDPEMTAHPLTKETIVQISNIQSSITMLMPTSAHPKPASRYENLFSDDKQNNVDDSGNDIINKIKLAERIYDNNTEDDEIPEKEDKKKTPKSFAAALNADLHMSAKGILTNKPKPSKHSVSADTSEDDLEVTFQPALSRKQRRQKKHSATKIDLTRRTSGASFADSESSLIDEENVTCLDDEQNSSFENQDSSANKGANSIEVDSTHKSNQEGWSFEADDLDVNRLIAEVVNDTVVTAPSFIESLASNQNEKQNLEEKACLDEVFKFDSELAIAASVGVANSEDDEKMEVEKNKWNNLNADEETSEDDNASNTILNSSKQKNNKMSKSLNVKVDTENNKIDKDTGTSSDNDNNVSSSAGGASKNQNTNKGITNLSQSLVLTEGTTSESSVGNSPNPRKTTKKSKKQKKKKF